MALLDDAQIREGLDRLDGWSRDGDIIRRDYEFDSFASAMAFVNEVARLAEDADHHPDIDIRFNRVRLALSTHSAGGLTRRDFDLAGRIDDHRAGSAGA